MSDNRHSWNSIKIHGLYLAIRSNVNICHIDADNYVLLSEGNSHVYSELYISIKWPFTNLLSER